MKKPQEKGFTLIELMMVLLIVGVLSVMSYSSYQDSVIKSKRSDAMGVLMGLANAMERYYTVNSSYSGVTLGTGGIYSDQSPIDGDTAYYTLSIDGTAGTVCADVATSSSSEYCLVATPVSGSSQDGDGIITLSSTGAKGWDKNSDGDTADSDENCWDTTC